MNILFTCAGRRTYLLKYFKEQLGNDGNIVAADMQLTAPALTAADIKLQVPSVYTDDYIESILEICKQHDIKAVISLNDLELPILAENKERFEAIGVTPIVSSKKVVDICFDKYETAQYIKRIGLETPLTFVNYKDAEKAIKSGELQFPLVLKPRWGAGSIGVEFVNDMDELKDTYAFLCRKIKKTILATVSKGDEYILIQQKIEGQEYGLDVMNDLEGKNRGVAVKKKLAMRAGETDKAQTIDNVEIRRIGRVLGERLGHIGNLDVDILEKDGTYYILELNPRFGGIFPFSYEAGVNYPKAILEWLKGKDVEDAMLIPKYGMTFAKCDYLVNVSHCSLQQIAIYGVGGFGREVMMLVEQINAQHPAFEIVGFFDDKVSRGTLVNGYPVLGGIHELNAWKTPLAIALAFGDPATKQKIRQQIVNTNVHYPSLIHPSVIKGSDVFVKIGEGCIICAGVLITVNIDIQDFVILNIGCTVGHDVKIGAYASFMPSVNISGEVEVGNGVYCGTGTKIINQLEIGEWTKVGAGAVVTKSLPAHCTAVGVPARPIKFHDK